MNEFGPWDHEENQDTWRKDDRDPDEVSGRDPGPFCSFCGSLHPEKFLGLIAEGWVVEPTDKTYKAYLSEVLTGPERVAIPGEPLPPVYCGRAKFYYQHFSDEQMQRFVDLYNDNTMRLGHPGYFYRMPFFMAVGEVGKE
jgi:hypothetical protein